MHTTTISRRAILAGVALASVTGVPAAASSPAAIDPALALWRTWWGHTVAWHRLSAESGGIWMTLPVEVQAPRVEMLDSWGAHQVAFSDQQIERHTPLESALDSWGMGMTDRERVRRAALRREAKAELARRTRAAEEHIIATGHRAVADRMSHTARLSRASSAAIENSRETTPVAIAMRCHYALDGIAQFSPDVSIDAEPASRGLAAIIRDLLPQLPAEMAAAMAPIADGWRPLRDIWGQSVETDKDR